LPLRSRFLANEKSRFQLIAIDCLTRRNEGGEAAGFEVVNQLRMDDSYSRQAQMNWPALYVGENVAWRGKPLRSKYTTKDAKLTLTGIPVAVFIAFWMSMALKIPKKGSPEDWMAWLFPAFGVIFVLQALYLLVGHYLRNWLEWKNVEYAVTNRRTVIRKGVWRVSELSRTHSDSPIEVRSSTDGALGDVIFQARSKLSINGLGQQLSGMFNPELRKGEFGLYAVEHPGDVYRTILAQTTASPNNAIHND
jgi:hypothetical protein